MSNHLKTGENNLQDAWQAPTIAAIATPIGQGGVGVIRLSGRDAYQIGCRLTKKDKLTPRYAHFARFWGEDDVIDEGVVIYFKAPHSFTGEDVVEIQGHGGMVLQNMLLARVFELGAKQASAGEFSYRAFENNKLDLVQAEAISDMISATSQAQAMSAMRSLVGGFSLQVNELVDKLTHLRLYVEASIDFSDEEDVDFLEDGVIAQKIEVILEFLGALLGGAEQGQLIRDGVSVVLAGKPNAGKSSLLNRLAGTERAIVTDVAGTTRDTLEEEINLGGLMIHLTDTAGLRQTDDKVEQIGINRAKDAIAQADILLMVYDVSVETEPLALAKTLFVDEGESFENISRKLIMVANKADLLNDVSHETSSLLSDELGFQSISSVRVSCATGQGIDELTALLRQKVGFHPPENALIARIRHIDALKRAKVYVLEAQEQLVVYQAGELVAESLRLAQHALGEITGQVSSDDLLGKIFSSFCIGK